MFVKLIFTRSGGSNPAKFDRLDMVTDAGPLAPIDCAKQGIIPHDMVHYAVEAEIAARGFLKLAADIGDSGVRVGIDDDHAGTIERLVETVQAEAWDAMPVSDEDFIALYRVTCAARGDRPLDLDPASLAAIRARIADLTAQWHAVPNGGTLVLTLTVPSHG
jgi:hypothetical protein